MDAEEDAGAEAVVDAEGEDEVDPRKYQNAHVTPNPRQLRRRAHKPTPHTLAYPADHVPR